MFLFFYYFCEEVFAGVVDGHDFPGGVTDDDDFFELVDDGGELLLELFLLLCGLLDDGLIF